MVQLTETPIFAVFGKVSVNWTRHCTWFLTFLRGKLQARNVYLILDLLANYIY